MPPSKNLPTKCSPVDPDSLADGEPRKRVTKACDRCRLKKIKCDGQFPCGRCRVENSLCRFGERRKSVDRRVPPGYVEYLEEQQELLVKALKKSWTELNPAVHGSNNLGEITVHQILQDLGVLNDLPGHRRSADGFKFEENFDSLQTLLEDETDTPSSFASAGPFSLPGTQASSPVTGTPAFSASPVSRGSQSWNASPVSNGTPNAANKPGLLQRRAEKARAQSQQSLNASAWLNRQPRVESQPPTSHPFSFHQPTQAHIPPELQLDWSFEQQNHPPQLSSSINPLQRDATIAPSDLMLGPMQGQWDFIEDPTNNSQITSLVVTV